MVTSSNDKPRWKHAVFAKPEGYVDLTKTDLTMDQTKPWLSWPSHQQWLFNNIMYIVCVCVCVYVCVCACPQRMVCEVWSIHNHWGCLVIMAVFLLVSVNVAMTLHQFGFIQCLTVAYVSWVIGLTPQSSSIYRWYFPQNIQRFGGYHHDELETPTRFFF